MNQRDDWAVRDTSVVMVADRPIETYTLSAETLRVANVTPQDWEEDPQGEGSSQTLVAYKNGVTISSQNTRCVFQLDLSGQFREDYEIHAVARRYLDVTRIVPYRFIGMNWSLYSNLPDPQEWLRYNLLTPKQFLQAGINLEIRMTKPLEFTSCNLTFTTRESEVVLDCNYHFDLNNISPIAAIDRWMDCHSHLKDEVVTNFLRSL